MPWQTPTLREVRRLVRDDIAAHLPGADATIPNNPLRVLADSNSGLAHGVYGYLDWQSEQYLPDTAETAYLDRHAAIWIGGRKAATFAAGTVRATGIEGTTIPSGSVLRSNSGIDYETTTAVVIGPGGTDVPVRSLTAGADGNQVYGAVLSFSIAIPGVDGTATVAESGVSGGIGVEDDESLRDRVLTRIRKPPQGGALHDYEAWAREVPGVTRAWAKSISIGSVLVRFMMDDDRPNGIPNSGDVDTVQAYIDARRPVGYVDFHARAPIPYPLDIVADQFVNRSGVAINSATVALQRLFREKAAPGKTFYRSWAGEAVSRATGEEHHELIFQTTKMPSPAHIAVLGGFKAL